MERLRLPSSAEHIVLAAQAVSPGVHLVGGAGLALLLGHRRSEDLDLFGALREDIEPVARAVEEAARSSGSDPRRVRSGPGFVRLEVPDGHQVLRVDIASDSARRLVETETRVGPIRVESLRDQRANKMVALLGRSELRDLVDLFFIEKAGLPIAQGFDDALSKDGGMDPMWFGWALDQIAVKPLPGMLVPLDLAELEEFRGRLRDAALEVAAQRRP